MGKNKQNQFFSHAQYKEWGKNFAQFFRFELLVQLSIPLKIALWWWQFGLAWVQRISILRLLQNSAY